MVSSCDVDASVLAAAGRDDARAGGAAAVQAVHRAGRALARRRADALAAPRTRRTRHHTQRGKLSTEQGVRSPDAELTRSQRRELDALVTTLKEVNFT